MRTVVTGGAGFIGSNLVDALARARRRGRRRRRPLDRQGENLASALAAGAALHERRHPRRRTRCASCSRRASRRRLPPRRADRRPRLGAPTRPTTRARTSRARSTCSRRPGARGVARASSSPRPAARSTARPTSFRRRRRRPARRWRAYGQSKFCAEHYLGLYERLTACRRWRCASATSTARARTRTARPASIAIFCGLLRRGERPKVYGDGEQTRDYIYVGDLVDGDRDRRRAATPPARSTSAPRRRRPCCGSSSCWRARAGERLRARARSTRGWARSSARASTPSTGPRAARLVGADRDRRGPAADLRLDGAGQRAVTRTPNSVA